VGNAVIRNKVRRRLRHLASERLDQLPAGTTVLVRALPAAADRTFQQLGRDLDAALAAAVAPRGTRRGKAPRTGDAS
jgi:ribonuclease P protein component